MSSSLRITIEKKSLPTNEICISSKRRWTTPSCYEPDYQTAVTLTEEEVYENAENIQKQASELHARLKKFNDDFFTKIGTDLGRAIKSYNDGVRSWESRLMPSVRKIEEMGIADSTRKIEAPKEKQEIPIDKDS